MRPRRAMRRRSCAPAPSRPTRPRISYENRLSSGLDIPMFHSYDEAMDHSLTTELSTSARMWGTLWGDRPDAWAVSEEQQTPVYEAALRCIGLEPGMRVLDVGCGTGVFLRMCADRGAIVSGLDAASGLLELARARVPEAELRLDDLQALPYDDDAFDVVTGFMSFFFAEDMVAALARGGAGRATGRAGGHPGLRAAGAVRAGGGQARDRGVPAGRDRAGILAPGSRRRARHRRGTGGRALVRHDVRLRIPGRLRARRGDARGRRRRR